MAAVQDMIAIAVCGGPSGPWHAKIHSPFLYGNSSRTIILLGGSRGAGHDAGDLAAGTGKKAYASDQYVSGIADSALKDVKPIEEGQARTLTKEFRRK